MVAINFPSAIYLQNSILSDIKCILTQLEDMEEVLSEISSELIELDEDEQLKDSEYVINKTKELEIHYFNNYYLYLKKMCNLMTILSTQRILN